MKKQTIPSKYTKIVNRLEKLLGHELTLNDILDINERELTKKSSSMRLYLKKVRKLKNEIRKLVDQADIVSAHCEEELPLQKKDDISTPSRWSLLRSRSHKGITKEKYLKHVERLESLNESELNALKHLRVMPQYLGNPERQFFDRMVINQKSIRTITAYAIIIEPPEDLIKRPRVGEFTFPNFIALQQHILDAFQSYKQKPNKFLVSTYFGEDKSLAEICEVTVEDMDTFVNTLPKEDSIFWQRRCAFKAEHLGFYQAIEEYGISRESVRLWDTKLISLFQAHMRVDPRMFRRKFFNADVLTLIEGLAPLSRLFDSKRKFTKILSVFTRTSYAEVTEQLKEYHALKKITPEIDKNTRSLKKLQSSLTDEDYETFRHLRILPLAVDKKNSKFLQTVFNRLPKNRDLRVADILLSKTDTLLKKKTSVYDTIRHDQFKAFLIKTYLSQDTNAKEKLLISDDYGKDKSLAELCKIIIEDIDIFLGYLSKDDRSLWMGRRGYKGRRLSMDESLKTSKYTSPHSLHQKDGKLCHLFQATLRVLPTDILDRIFSATPDELRDGLTELRSKFDSRVTFLMMLKIITRIPTPEIRDLIPIYTEEELAQYKTNIS